MNDILIRPARPDELGRLDALVLRSKSHWTEGRVEDVPHDTPPLTAEDIESRHATVAERDGVPIGFFTLREYETYLGIDLLFVDRPFIGTGVGRLLWDEIVWQAGMLGAQRLGVGAEPQAEGFYLRMGMGSHGEFFYNGERLIWMTGDVGALAG